MSRTLDPHRFINQRADCLAESVEALLHDQFHCCIDTGRIDTGTLCSESLREFLFVVGLAIDNERIRDGSNFRTFGLWTRPSDRLAPSGPRGQALEKCSALTHRLTTLASLVTTGFSSTSSLFKITEERVHQPELWSGGEDGYFAFHIELMGGRVGKGRACARFGTQHEFLSRSFGAHTISCLGQPDRAAFLEHCPKPDFCSIRSDIRPPLREPGT
jgi:hypothetical protein